MFVFAAILVALFAIFAALCPVWFTKRRQRRTLIRVDFAAGIFGAVLAAIAAVLMLVGVHNAADRGYALWIGETLRLDVCLLFFPAVFVTLLTILSAAVTPGRWHVIRAVLFPVATAGLLLLTALFAPTCENGGAVAADTLLWLFGIGTSLLPAVAGAVDHLFYLRQMPAEPKKPRRKKGKKKR